MFIRDSWYVAAWSADLDTGPVARTLLNEPVLMFRTPDGGVSALLDQCPHRALPLSKGEVRDGLVRCAYHGMQFDGAGRCVEIPSQTQIPPNARVKTFPIAELYGLVWIWMGDADAADTSTIPDLHWLKDDLWGAKGALFTVECNWRLILDNLMDLTHLTFVHSRTIGNAATTIGAETQVERVNDSAVRVTRWMMAGEAPPTYKRAGAFVGPIDRWQIITFSMPSLIRIDVGATDAGTGAREGRRSGGIGMQNINMITPETERSSHYFWAQAHDFSPRDPVITNAIYHEIHATFLEDVGIFEAQQRALERDIAPARVDLISDRGGVHVRRMIDRALKDAAAAIPGRLEAAE